MSVREATKENFHELIQENVVVVEFFLTAASLVNSCQRF